MCNYERIWDWEEIYDCSWNAAVQAHLLTKEEAKFLAKGTRLLNWLKEQTEPRTGVGATLIARLPRHWADSAQSALLNENEHEDI